MIIRKRTHDVLFPPRKRALKPGLESLEGRVVLSTYTPSQIRSAYGIDGISFGGTTGNGAGQTIAIIEGLSDPYIGHDLTEFDAEFGLPAPPSFQVLNQEGGTSLPTPERVPGQGAVQAGEECMDVEWAHAIAPGASLIVIECNSVSLGDLGVGIRTAAGLPGVSVVSTSFDIGEFSMEHTQSDPYYTTPSGHQGVTFVAASGDNGAPGGYPNGAAGGYPANSPYVVAVGGTSLLINPDGSYNSEIGWSGSGGDISQYEPEPAYQEGVQSSGKRTVPDVSFDANEQTGVYVYDTLDYLLGNTDTLLVPDGGTSFASPAWAGLIAIANQGRVIEGGTTLNSSSDPTQTLTALYSLPPSDFHDITSGSNGEFRAGPGYDLVTGLGTPIANLLVPDLAAYGTATHLVVTDQPPGSVHAKRPFTVVIAAEDATGQVDSSFDGSVKLTLPNRKTVKVHALNGLATFGNLSVSKLGKAEKIEAAASSLTSVTTDPFHVTKAIARKQHQQQVQADLAAPKKLQHRGQHLPRHGESHSGD
jgi:subtilase family serine protease